MGIFPFAKKNAADYFSAAEKAELVTAIRQAERRTSGEVRLFIESKCRYVQAMDRADEIFFGLKMEATENRNAVLVYIAIKDRQFALFADKGIYEAMGENYWTALATGMKQNFINQSPADGLVKVISAIGEALSSHFPYDGHTDKNELPDDIVFGH